MTAVDWSSVGLAVRKKRRRDLRTTAQKAKVNYHALWRIERGDKPHTETFLRVCKALGIDPLAVTGIGAEHD